MIAAFIRRHRERRLAGLKARLGYWEAMRTSDGEFIPWTVAHTVADLRAAVAKLETALQQTTP